MNRVRTAAELFGFVAIALGAFLWSPVAGLVVAGVSLILLANFAGDN